MYKNCAPRKVIGAHFLYQIRQSSMSIGAMHRMSVETSSNKKVVIRNGKFKRNDMWRIAI